MPGSGFETTRCLCKEEEIKITGKIGRTTAAAIEDQKRIGKHLMLLGILSRRWRDAITKHTKERVQCKASHLVKVIWKQMFMPMWSKQNKILHTKDIIAVTREHEILDKTLDRFRLNLRELLHHTQYNLAEFTEEQTQHW